MKSLRSVAGVHRRRAGRRAVRSRLAGSPELAAAAGAGSGAGLQPCSQFSRMQMRDDVDLDARVAGQSGRLDRGAGRGRRREQRGVDLVHGGEVVHVRQVDGGLHHRVEAGARGRQDGSEIGEDLARLAGDIAGRPSAPCGIQRNLAGAEHPAIHHDGLRIRTDGLRRRFGGEQRRALSELSGLHDLVGAEAPRADAEPADAAVHQRADRLQVGLEPAGPDVVCVADGPADTGPLSQISQRLAMRSSWNPSPGAVTGRLP